MQDKDIYELIHSKNQDGLSRLLDQYGSLISYIVRNTGITNPEDLSECISDILFAVWKRIKKFDLTKSSFKTWVVMLTRGCSIDYLRKNKKRISTVSIDQVPEISEESAELNKVLEPNLIQLLQELPPPDNEIFYHRFILGEAVTEIANILDLTNDAIYKRINRGKTKLRELMEREGIEYV
ncbi:MAG TPA: hypothetical protein DIW17_07505 [Clostridiales bacterium]|nr:hypothetical protein [Clostridiales bacterium]